MELIIDELIELLNSPAGNMAYHLIISFAILGAFTTTFLAYIQNKSIYNRRILLGISSLLILRISLFIIIGLIGQNYFGNLNLVPEISRFFDTLNLFAFFGIWLFSFPKTEKISYTYFVWLILFFLGVLILFIWITFSPPISIGSNPFLPYTNLFNIIFLYIGIVLIYSWKPKNWFLGFMMFCLLFLGEISQAILYSNQSDYPFIMRLFQLLSMPLLFGLNFDNPEPGRINNLANTKNLEIQIIETNEKAFTYQNENILLLQEIAALKENHEKISTKDLDKLLKNKDNLELENQYLTKKLATLLKKKENNPLDYRFFYPTSINLSHILNEVLNLISTDLHEKQISLRIDLPENLPEIISDKKAVMDILSTILMHSSSSCSPNSEIYISTKVEKILFENQFILLGIAIDEINLTSNTEISHANISNNLGSVDKQFAIDNLEILKSMKIAEALGGNLTIENIPGKGLAFLLKIPLNLIEDQVSENS